MSSNACLFVSASLLTARDPVEQQLVRLALEDHRRGPRSVHLPVMEAVKLLNALREALAGANAGPAVDDPASLAVHAAREWV